MTPLMRLPTIHQPHNQALPTRLSRQICVCACMAVTVVGVTACGTYYNQDGQRPSAALHTENQNFMFKRTVFVDSMNADLQTQVETAFYKHPLLLQVSDPAFAEFHISLQERDSSSNVLSPSFRLMGKLNKDKYPVSTTFIYTLSSQNNSIQKTGEILGVGEAQTHIVPSLVRQNEQSPEMLADVAKQLVEVVVENAGNTPWQATVVGQKDLYHITISAGATVGIQLGDVFETTEDPPARLQVVMFEESPAGDSRAVLRVIDGFLPTTGRTVVPSARLVKERR